MKDDDDEAEKAASTSKHLVYSFVSHYLKITASEKVKPIQPGLDHLNAY